RGRQEPIFFCVFIRKTSLINVSNPFTSRCQLITPVVGMISFTTLRRELPLCLCRKSFTSPFGICRGIFIRYMSYGVIFPAFDRAGRAFRVRPACTSYIGPPLQRILKRNPVRGWCKNGRARYQFVGRDTWVVSGVQWSLGNRF